VLIRRDRRQRDEVALEQRRFEAARFWMAACVSATILSFARAPSERSSVRGPRASTFRAEPAAGAQLEWASTSPACSASERCQKSGSERAPARA